MNYRIDLVPSAITKKAQEEHKVKKEQNSKMNALRMNQNASLYEQASAASGDRAYMAKALQEIRKSSITNNEDMIRQNGTYLYNKTLDNK